MLNDDIIIFGNYNWRVLDSKDNSLLIITEEIIELRWYNDNFVDITWEECTLRKYLNNDFLNTFNQNEKAKIIPVTNTNQENPWFKTKGGITETARQSGLGLKTLQRKMKKYGLKSEDFKNLP